MWFQRTLWVVRPGRPDGRIYSRYLYSADNGILAEVGRVYYYLDISVGMWCDADGSNPKKTFDPTRYISHESL